MNTDYIKLALKYTAKNRLRTSLTLLGILISIATIFILISVSLGLEAAVEEQFRALGSDKFFIQPRGQLAGPGSAGAVSLTDADIRAIARVSGVKEVSFWVLSSAQIEYKDEIRFTSVAGFDMDNLDLLMETGSYKSQEGRLLREGDTRDVMIGSQFKENNFIGRPVRVGDKLTINSREFEVRGILETVGNPQDDRLIYMPEEELRDLFEIPDRIDFIIVQVEDESRLKEVAKRTEKKLMSVRDVTEKTKDFTILTPEELLESFGTILSIITSFLIGVAAISLIVGGIGIANTVYTSVLERTKEIGVMKAIGAQNKEILYIFLTESSLLGLLGGSIGIVLGIAVSKGIEYYAVTRLGTNLLRAVIPVYLVIGCLAFSILAGAISGFWPAYQATKVRPVEALRYE